MNSILIISPERWDEHTVSKHHYAKTLAESGRTVFFLNPPDNNLNSITIDSTHYPNLNIVSSPKVFRGLRFVPSYIRRLLEGRWLSNLEILAGTKIDTIWLFENSRFFDMRFADDRLKIYHQVDLNQDFNKEIAAKTADICFAVSDIIKDKLVDYNKYVFKITHGTNNATNLVQLGLEELKRFQLTGNHVVYIGNLDIPCLDTNLLKQLFKHFPKVNFHLVGQYSIDGKLWQASEQFPNVVWWGKVHSDQIPAILNKADILLVTYKTDKWEYVANPHKFMEYFLSGKVIVSTYTDEYKDKRRLLAMTDRSDNFIQLFAKVIDNLDKYNCSDLQKIRTEFSKSHTYKKQLERILHKIQESGLTLDRINHE